NDCVRRVQLDRRQSCQSCRASRRWERSAPGLKVATVEPGWPTEQFQFGAVLVRTAAAIGKEYSEPRDHTQCCCLVAPRAARFGASSRAEAAGCAASPWRREAA